MVARLRYANLLLRISAKQWECRRATTINELVTDLHDLDMDRVPVVNIRRQQPIDVLERRELQRLAVSCGGADHRIKDILSRRPGISNGYEVAEASRRDRTSGLWS